MLDTSAGQLTMLAATANAYGVPIQPLARRIVPGYSAFDEDLTGYDRHYNEFVGSGSPEETAMIKQMIDNNTDLRTGLEDYAGLRFLAGVVDPINIIPIPYAVGHGFLNGAKRAVKMGGAVNASTEVLRHVIDPTSTVEETAFATLAGTLFMGVMGGSAGMQRIDTPRVSDVLNRMTPPKGTTSMFAGVPWHMGTTKGVFKRVGDALRSTAGDGPPMSRTVDPDRIRVDEFDNGKTVYVFVDDNQIATLQRRGEDLHMVDIEVPPEMRKRGIGTAVYKRAIEHAEQNGLGFKSDSKVSADAQKRWKGLEDEGYKIKKLDEKLIDIDPDGAENASRSIYSVERQVDADQVQVPQAQREALADMETGIAVLKSNFRALTVEVKALKEKVAKAPVAGGAKTKAKRQLKTKLKDLNKTDYQLRRAKSAHQDLNVLIAQMLDEATIKDWDLLPTGYNKILGKTQQMPWWSLLKTPLRELAPEIAPKVQRFALKMAATPGLNNKGNRMGASTGPSVEASSFEYTGRWLEATRDAQQLYRKYAGYGETSGQIKHFTIDTAQRVRSAVNRAGGGEKITTTKDGKLTIAEFENQISIALSKGGKHDIPEVAQAASLYRPVLDEIAADAKKFQVTSTQQMINRRIGKLDEKIDDLNGKYPDSMPPWAVQKIQDAELEKMRLKENMLKYGETDERNFIHRMWIGDEVRAREIEVKEMIQASFERDWAERGYKVNADKMRAEVNEAYASILHDADMGNDLQFRPDDTERRSWLESRKGELEKGTYQDSNGTVLGKAAKYQIEIIEGKLQRIAMGDLDNGIGGPLGQRQLNLDNAELIKLGVIEGNINNWMQHYVSRTAPLIETARIFGDAKATRYIDDTVAEIRKKASLELDPGKKKELMDLAKRTEEDMHNLRDVVHGVYQIPDDPSSMTGRVLRSLRNWNIIGAMGRSVFMAFGDIGNVMISQGMFRSMGHAVETFASGITDGKIKMMRDEVDLAGSTSEVILGMRYAQMTDAGQAVGRTTRFERGLAGASQRFFLLNLLGPWTDMARRFSGGMVQSRIIENARLWKAGQLAEDQIEIMGRLGINKQQAIQFADEWEASGKVKHKSMFIASTDQWVSEQAKRTFRAAMNTEINRMVPTPGAVDKPLGLLKSDWWKVIGQYRGFSIAATHRIMGAGLHTKGASKYSGMAAMVGIAMMVDAFKRPDYIQMPIEEQLLRAVELSGVTGIVLDMNDTIERASAGTIGLRPSLGMDIRERNPNWANRMGTVGAVPNQWLTLMYGLTSDEAETDDTARAIRYMIPYNNLLWWNEAFNRAQRSTVDLIEEEQ